MKTFRLTSVSLILVLFIATFRVVPSTATPESNYWDEPGVRLLSQPLGEYRGRRQALLSQVTDGVVVILGNVEEDLGVEARYRQNNWMAYLTGVRTPGAAVVLVPQGLP